MFSFKIIEELMFKLLICQFILHLNSLYTYSVTFS